MSKDQEQLRCGVYGWITCPEIPGHSFFVQTNGEDHNKSEGTIYTKGGKKQVREGLHAIVTGGIRQGETVEEALLREIHEELGLSPSELEVLKENLPRVVVHQDRDGRGKNIGFFVYGRKVSIPWSILKKLTEKQVVTAIPDDELLNELTHENTREAVYAIVKRMTKRLERERVTV